jgi:hypothetical protein
MKTRKRKKEKERTKRERERERESMLVHSITCGKEGVQKCQAILAFNSACSSCLDAEPV